MPSIEEFESAISNASTVREKINALLALAKEIQNTDNQRATSLVEIALTLLKSNQDFILEKAQALLVLGWCKYLTSDFVATIKYCTEARNSFTKAENKMGVADSLNNLGNAYNALSDYPNALKHFQESLSIRRDIKDVGGIAGSLNNIGNVYLYLADYPNALKHFEECHNLSHSIGNKRGLAASLGNIGVIYEKLNDYPIALKQFQASLVIHRSIGNGQGIANSLISLGNVYYSMSDYPQAVKHFQEGLDTSNDLGYKQGIAISKLNLGLTLIKFEQFDAAETELTQALSLCEDLGLKYPRFETLKALAQVYAAIHQYKKAYLTFIDYHHAKDLVFSEENQKKISNLHFMFETQQSQKEAELYRLKNIDLVEANRLKSELLSLAAHDLKSPLQSILGFAQLIQESEDVPKHIEKKAGIIVDASKTMNRLIVDLLDTAELEQGRLLVNASVFYLSDIAKNIIRQYQPQAERKNQQLTFQMNSLCPIESDADKVHRIFENLLSNAIKYSPEGKSIWIILKDLDSTIEIRIQDEGLGFTKSDMEKVFQKFQRLSARPTGGESSSGLGLSITKQLVELLGGNIHCSSAGKNQGTTFIVHLPKAPAPVKTKT